MNALPQRLEDAETFSIMPDMAVLAAGRETPPAMPNELFGNAWSIVEDLARGTNAPIDYAGLSLLVTAAAAIGGKRRVSPFGTPDWQEPCVLWGVNVGLPSTKKSRPAEISIDALRSIEADSAAEYEAELLVYQVGKDVAEAAYSGWQKELIKATANGSDMPEKPSAATLPVEPIRKRHVVKDITTEKLNEILSGNPAGVLFYRDELKGWFDSFERYSNSGRSGWLENYRGSSDVIDRKGGGTMAIPYNGVCVFGTIQPEKLRAVLIATDDDGLAARFLYAWPAKVPYARPGSVSASPRLELLYRKLCNLDWAITDDGNKAPRILPFDDDAADLFDTYMATENEEIETLGSLLGGFYGKRGGVIARLSLIGEMIDHAIRGTPEPQSISAKMVGAAIDFYEDYALPSARAVFGECALPEVERNMAILARYITKNRMQKINARELKRTPHKGKLPTLRKAEAMTAAIEGLVDAGWLFSMPQRDGGTSGRQSLDFTVNPHALEE